MSDESLKRDEHLKKRVNVASLLSALEPVMDALVKAERRIEKMQLAQAALEGRLDQLTRSLEASIERRAPISQVSPRRLIG